MNRIIHIASDEKFINSAHWQFNHIYPDQNIFYLLVDNVDIPLRHVTKQKDMVLISNTIANLKNLSSKFDEANLICFHGLSYYSSIVLNNTSSKYKILWFLWGTEIHSNPVFFLKNQILGPATSKLYFKGSDSSLKTIIKNSFRNSFYKLKNRTSSPFKEIAEAIKKTDYCGILYEEEFKLIRETVKINIEQVVFSYYPIEKMVANVNARVTSNNILLGNSASFTNNHLEVFEMLSEFSLENRKVITPLSYGDNAYKESIIEKGQQILNKNFTPLTDFMPLHEYNEYLEQCGIVIMNHYRQQAVGNVLTMLWMGAKVYLDERNTLYHYLKRIGVNIYSISKDLNSNNANSLTVLKESQQNHNREVLRNEINQEDLLDKLSSQLAQIL